MLGGRKEKNRRMLLGKWEGLANFFQNPVENQKFENDLGSPSQVDSLTLPQQQQFPALMLKATNDSGEHGIAARHQATKSCRTRSNNQTKIAIHHNIIMTAAPPPRGNKQASKRAGRGKHGPKSCRKLDRFLAVSKGANKERKSAPDSVTASAIKVQLCRCEKIKPLR
jgi:hypothetical protein